MFDINSNILVKSGVNADQLNEALLSIRSDHKLKDATQAFVDAEKKYGISSLFIAAHAATESGWGHSMFANTRNNIFGFNAVDSNPGLATRYPSKSDSVRAYAEFLNNNYLYEGQQYYNGASPLGIMVRYASAGKQAAETIVWIMNKLAAHLNITSDPIPDGFATIKATDTPVVAAQVDTTTDTTTVIDDPEPTTTDTNNEPDTKKKRSNNNQSAA